MVSLGEVIGITININEIFEIDNPKSTKNSFLTLLKHIFIFYFKHIYSIPVLLVMIKYIIFLAFTRNFTRIYLESVYKVS